MLSRKFSLFISVLAVETWVERVKVLRVKIVLTYSQCLTEALEMHKLTLT